MSVVVVVLGRNTSKQKLTIEQLGNVSRFFNTAPLCKHNSDIKTGYDDNGRIHISFRTKLEPNESEGKL